MRQAIRKYVERREHKDHRTRWMFIPVDVSVAEKIVFVVVLALGLILWVVL